MVKIKEQRDGPEKKGGLFAKIDGNGSAAAGIREKNNFKSTLGSSSIFEQVSGRCERDRHVFATSCSIKMFPPFFGSNVRNVAVMPCTRKMSFTGGCILYKIVDPISGPFGQSSSFSRLAISL